MKKTTVLGSRERERERERSGPGVKKRQTVTFRIPKTAKELNHQSVFWSQI